LQQTIAEREDFCNWLAGETLRAERASESFAQQLQTLQEERDYLFHKNAEITDEWLATKDALDNMAQAHRTLKVQYAAVINAERNSTKRVRELQHKPAAKKAKAGEK
jgi:hypothetical protein